MTNQPLLEFVKGQLQLGLSKEAITAMLVSQGWSSLDISEAFGIIMAQNLGQTPPPAVPATAPAPAIPSFTGGPLQTQQQGKPKTPGKIILITIVSIVVVLCLAATGVFAYYKLVPPTPTQILENALHATLGHTQSFSFDATSTGTIATTKASTYNLPTSVNFSVAGSGALDFHSKPENQASLDFTLNASSTSPGYADSVLVSISTIYASSSLYVNLRNLTISLQTPADQGSAAEIVAAVNAFAGRLENEWIDIPAASSTVSASSQPNAAQLSEIDSYIFGMSYVKSISNLGTESVGGMETYHLSIGLQDDGQLTALIRNISLEQHPELATSTEFAAQMTNLSQTLSHEVTVDIWVGTNDSRIYKIAAGPFSFSDAQSGAVSSSSYQTDFSNYGQVMGITPPANSITLAQLLQNFFGGFAATTTSETE